MESGVQPVKSDKEIVESSEKSRKRKMSGSPTGQGAARSSAPIMSREQESVTTIVLPEEPIEQSNQTESQNKIDAAMRNQISSSRATTVELDSLRDLMPKLRKEINTYSINECQLIKELEKKLPSCYEHRDVRLNIVLEEIQRLRINRRRALAKLKEATVKIIELQARMEMTSYEAGEVFWNGKISRLSEEKYAKPDMFTDLIEEKESKENFSFPSLGPSVGTFGSSPAGILDKIPENRGANTGGTQGYVTEMASGASTATYAQADISEDATIQKNMMIQSAIIEAVSKGSSKPVAEGPQQASSIKFEAPDTSSIPQPESSPQSNNPRIDGSGIDFEQLVADAQKQAGWRAKFTKKGILLAVIPPAAAISAILVLDWLTGIVSNTLGALFG